MSMHPTAELSVDTIRRALAEYEVACGDEQIQQVQRYLRLLLLWNEKLNLTALRDPLEILHRHFCESMYAAPAVPMENGRLADVGSGGGFPGMPLKILRPELDVFLIESNVKKATFLAELSRELGLNARVLVNRYEELHEEVAPLKYVCSRALGDFDRFLRWAGSEYLSVEQVILWIGGRDLENIRCRQEWNWREPILVPHSLRRYVLVGERRASDVPRETIA